MKKKTYPLTIEIVGNGSVTEKVIKSGAVTDYKSGTVLELTAVAETDWSFLKWSGDINLSQNPVEVTVDQAKTIKAEFYQPTNFTGLPIVYVNTSGVPIDSKEDYVEGSVHISGEGTFSDLSETNMKN